MAETSVTPRRPWRRRLFYLTTIGITAALSFLLMALVMNIQERKQEAQEHFLKLAELDEDTLNPAIWGRNFPRQYDGYRRTVDTERTRHGGSEAIDKLKSNPRLLELYRGYAFSKDFREERGHAYMLKDQDESRRVIVVNQPGACLHCHSSVLAAYRKEGNGDVMVGFKKVCAQDWEQARKLVEHPVSCVDCHDPKTVQLRVTRPGFLLGIQDLADFLADLRNEKEGEKKKDSTREGYKAVYPHLTSLEQYAKTNAGIPRKERRPYDVNTLATRQELRSFVCGQCHVEYYFKKEEGNLLVYPWAKGLKVEEIENYYDERNFADWKHKTTGAALLKAQHPEFEVWNQGIHARSGVSCADCHIPYRREGAIKVSDHHIRSPLLNIARACQTCHRYPEQEILARATLIQDRTKALLDRTEEALIDLLGAIKSTSGKTRLEDKSLAAAKALHRKAQWRWDFVSAENSMGFHASQECARILAEAIYYARQGQISVLGQQKD